MSPLLESAVSLSSLRAALALLAFVALVGCPKPQPPAEPVKEEPPPKEAPVAITRVDPSSTPQGRAATVTVMGRGFEDGAEVFLSSQKMGGVDVVDGKELSFRAPESLAAGRYDVRVVRPDGEQATAPAGFTVIAPQDSGCVLKPIYFDYDQAVLSSSARTALSDDARCIQSRKPRSVRLEGHADERGDTEYNLALGQRRADAVKGFLADYGVSGSNLLTVSYGEERPADAGHDETAWSRNRRVEVVAE